MTFDEMNDIHNAKVQHATATEAKDFSPKAPGGSGTGFSFQDIEAAKATARKFKDLHDRINERSMHISKTKDAATRGFCGDDASQSYADTAGNSLQSMHETNLSMVAYAQQWIEAINRAIDHHQQNDQDTAQALQGHGQ